MAKKTARPKLARPATMKRWHQALDHPAVRKRFEFWSSQIGELPPYCFLLAILGEWDCTDGAGKADAMLHYLGCQVTKEHVCAEAVSTARKAEKARA